MAPSPYCGRYEIDVKQKQIVHLPEVATSPTDVGSRQRPGRTPSRTAASSLARREGRSGGRALEDRLGKRRRPGSRTHRLPAAHALSAVPRH